MKSYELNTVLAFGLAHALHGFLDSQYNDADRAVAMELAEPVRIEAEKALAYLPRPTKSEEKSIFRKLERLKDRIWSDGEVFQHYCNFTLAVLEYIQRYKMPDVVRKQIDETADSIVGLLTHFDPEFEDTKAAETADRAFREWLIVID